MAHKGLTDTQQEYLKEIQSQLSQNVVANSTEKAYVTGHEVNPEELTDAGALRQQQLEDRLTTLTFSEEDLYFYLNVPRKPASSTVVQYNVLNSYGEVGSTRFVAEEDIAPQNDAQIDRKLVRLKFLSDTRNVSFAAQRVNETTESMDVQTDASLRVVAKTIEWASYYGDADLSDSPAQGDGLQFDGLAKMIAKGAPENVLDAKGAPLTEQMLNVASTRIAKGYGTATDAFMPIGVLNNFNNTVLGRQRIFQTATPNGSLSSGVAITNFQSVRGNIELHGSTVMENDNILAEDFKPSRNAPLPAQLTATAKTGAKGKFREEDIGEHVYVVTVNGVGTVSAPSKEAVATVANADDGVELTVTLQTMYQQSPQFVSIYRKGKSGDFRLIKRIATKGENTLTFTDVNDVLPDTADVFVGQFTEDVVSIYELLPLVKVDMARTNASTTFSVLWYGALALKAPRKFAHIKNVAYVPTNDVL